MVRRREVTIYTSVCSTTHRCRPNGSLPSLPSEFPRIVFVGSPLSEKSSSRILGE
jgi:hypothetical protein